MQKKILLTLTFIFFLLLPLFLFALEIKGREYTLKFNKDKQKEELSVTCESSCSPNILRKSLEIEINFKNITRLNRVKPYYLSLNSKAVKAVRLFSMNNNLALKIFLKKDPKWSYEIKRNKLKADVIFKQRGRAGGISSKKNKKEDKEQKSKAKAKDKTEEKHSLNLYFNPSQEEGKATTAPALLGIKYNLSSSSLVFSFNREISYQLTTVGIAAVKIVVPKSILAREELKLPFFAPKDFPFVEYVKAEDKEGALEILIKTSVPVEVIPRLVKNNLIITFQK